MIVWAGCLTCRHDKRARKWEGLWVDEEVYPTLTVYDIHQPGYLPDIDDHVMHAFTLTDFGVPLEASEEELSYQAEFMAWLEEHGISEPVTVWALSQGLQPWQIDADEFLARYQGQWHGKPTRAARKRYVFVRTTPGIYYIFKRNYVRVNDAVRRAVQV